MVLVMESAATSRSLRRFLLVPEGSQSRWRCPVGGRGYGRAEPVTACQALGPSGVPKGTRAAAAPALRHICSTRYRVHLLRPVLHLKEQDPASSKLFRFQNAHHSKVLLRPRRGLALLCPHLPVSVSTSAGLLGHSSSPSYGARWLPAPQRHGHRMPSARAHGECRPSSSCLLQRLSCKRVTLGTIPANCSGGSKVQRVGTLTAPKKGTETQRAALCAHRACTSAGLRDLLTLHVKTYAHRRSDTRKISERICAQTRSALGHTLLLELTLCKGLLHVAPASAQGLLRAVGGRGASRR